MDETGFNLYTYMTNPEMLAIKDGHIELLTRPGLGVEINEELVRSEATKGERFGNPVVRGGNGEIREW